MRLNFSNQGLPDLLIFTLADDEANQFALFTQLPEEFQQADRRHCKQHRSCLGTVKDRRHRILPAQTSRGTRSGLGSQLNIHFNIHGNLSPK